VLNTEKALSHILDYHACKRTDGRTSQERIVKLLRYPANGSLATAVILSLKIDPPATGSPWRSP